MFNNMRETIKSLNSDVDNVANIEKAKKLKKKLLAIGIPMAIIGYLGLFTCFILFATAGFSAFKTTGFGFSARVLVPFILFILCFFIGVTGSVISSLGLKIVITGYEKKSIDKTVGNNCPKCGNTVELDKQFCINCGEYLKKECPNCKQMNSNKAGFCEYCGNKLN